MEQDYSCVTCIVDNFQRKSSTENRVNIVGCALIIASVGNFVGLETIGTFNPNWYKVGIVRAH